jgi:RHS repeat-associated protein
LGCLKLTYITNLDLVTNEFKKELTSNFSNLQVQGGQELTNHLGNVLATISDRKTYNPIDGYYEPVITMKADYYAFGMLMPGRNEGISDARHLFNGMEHDMEVSGDGNSYTTEFRQYDPRLGRWKSLDPLMMKYPHMSPYVAFNNNPIFYTDPLGLEGKPVQDRQPYHDWIENGLDEQKQWAYSSAAYFDQAHGQVSFSHMDAMEGHSGQVFNSYHFVRVTDFQRKNAQKESSYNRGEITAGRDANSNYLKCSPSLNGMINRLYNSEDNDKIYKTEVEGENSIMSVMRQKGLTGSEKTFVGLDSNGKESHNSKKDPVKLSSNIASWAESETEMNGVGFFLISVSGGYHSLMLVVDRRGNDITYRLLDQHGNKTTGSKSSFDRLKAHTADEINNYFLAMVFSWYGVNSNANIKAVELNRD